MSFLVPSQVADKQSGRDAHADADKVAPEKAKDFIRDRAEAAARVSHKSPDCCFDALPNTIRDAVQVGLGNGDAGAVLLGLIQPND